MILNFSLVLHGHVHDNRQYQRRGLRFLNGGASIEAYKAQICVNLIVVNSRRRSDRRIERFHENSYTSDEIHDPESLIPRYAG
jgi:predicted phosphodiesterase